jgi:hypothetical protein
VLLVCTLIAALGNGLYALVPFFGAISLNVLVASRFVIGASTATLGVCRGHLATVSTVQDRTKLISWAGLLQFVGFSLTPGLGGFMIQYSTPGVVMVAMNVATFALLLIAFDNNANLPDPTPDRETSTVEPIYARLQEEENNNEIQLELVRSASDKPETALHDDEIVTDSSSIALLTSDPSSTVVPMHQQSSEVQSSEVISRTMLYQGFAFFLLLNFVLRGACGTVTTKTKPVMYFFFFVYK